MPIEDLILSLEDIYPYSQQNIGHVLVRYRCSCLVTAQGHNITVLSVSELSDPHIDSLADLYIVVKSSIYLYSYLYKKCYIKC